MIVNILLACAKLSNTILSDVIKPQHVSPKANKVLLQILQKSEADFSWLQRANGAPAKVRGRANSPVTTTTTLRARQGHQECPQPLLLRWQQNLACGVGTELRHGISPQAVLQLPKVLEHPPRHPQMEKSQTGPSQRMAVPVGPKGWKSFISHPCWEKGHPAFLPRADRLAFSAEPVS